ncbi:hypothetical protein FGF1_14950 [Flavobacteriaceae bacterium GF1]
MTWNDTTKGIMKLIIALVLFTSGLLAQTGKFSTTISYPLPMGENNFGQLDGIVDLGVAYRVITFGNLYLGGGLNVGVYDEKNETIDFVRKSSLIQPKVLVELKLTRFRPFAGLGYVFWNQKNEFPDLEDISFKWNGLNFNLGVSVDILPKLFIVGQIDIIKLSGGDSLPDSSSFRNITVVKIGAGVRL